MATRKTAKPRQTITSLTVNMQRCFDRVDKLAERVESFMEINAKAAFDFDSKIASLQKQVGELANLEAHVHAENVRNSASMPTSGGMLNTVRAREDAARGFLEGGNVLQRPFTYGNLNPTPRSFLVRYHASSGEKTKSVNECYGITQNQGMTNLVDKNGVVLFCVPQGKVNCIEVID